MAGLAAASAALAFAGGDINCHGGTCEGTNGNDVFFGSNQPERILAKGGLDFVFSAARGDDTIKFGPGADCGAGGEGRTGCSAAAATIEVWPSAVPTTGCSATRAPT